MSQSSLAVSADGETWAILNASPESAVICAFSSSRFAVKSSLPL